MDLEGASGQVRISLENGASAEERRFAKTTQAIEPPPAEHDEATPGSGDNGASANDAPRPPRLRRRPSRVARPKLAQGRARRCAGRRCG